MAYSPRRAPEVVADSDPEAEHEGVLKLAALEAAAIDLAESEALREMKVLMLDNYDSFTYNLVTCCEELGAEFVAMRNDAITVEEGEAWSPTTRHLTRPGASRGRGDQRGRPSASSDGDYPVSSASASGTRGLATPSAAKWSALAPVLMHGKVSSPVQHDGRWRLRGRLATVRRRPLPLPDRGDPARPTRSKISARTDDGDHHGAAAPRRWPVHGVQFHPGERARPRSGPRWRGTSSR